MSTNLLEEEVSADLNSPGDMAERQVATPAAVTNGNGAKDLPNHDLFELAKINLQAFENRRSMEWQLLLGYWTGLGLVTYIFVSGTLSVSGALLWVVVAALVAMLAVLIMCCILPIQKAHAIDHKFFVHYLRRIEGAATAEDRPHPRKIRMYRPWLVGQSLFSTLLTIIAIVMIAAGGKVKGEKNEEAKVAAGSVVTPSKSAAP
jgi:hypothetical protein